MIQLDVRECTFAQVLSRQREAHGGKTFLHFLPDGRRFSYRDMDEMSGQIAAGLVAMGVAKGSHVAVMMENCPEQLLLYFALGKIGAVTVPINTAARGEQLRHLVALSEATVVVTDEELVANLAPLAGTLSALKDLVVMADDLSVVPVGGAEKGWRVSAFDSLLRHGAAPPTSEARFNDLAFLMYTSGTTGPSKLNMYTQSHCVLYAYNNALEHDYRDSDVAYVCLPLFHISALFGVSLAAMCAGASIVMTRRFSLSRFWDEVRGNGVTLLNSLGAMSEFLWNLPAGPQDRDHRVRLCRMVPVPRYAREFEARFGVTIVSGYGLSDFAQVAAFTAKDPRDKLGSAGRPRKGIQLRIVDDDDFDVAPGTPGEIVVRSDNLWNTSQGYYKMPEATLAAMRNQWFHTGDRGYLDADGYLFFVDRKKDSLRRRGENISAAEVEQAIATHPAVMAVAVYPLPAENLEDEVAATVVLREGMQVTGREIIEHCVQNMAYFMVPRFLDFAPDLPRTLTNRVQKFKLVESAKARRTELFDREKEGIALRSGRR